MLSNDSAQYYGEERHMAGFIPTSWEDRYKASCSCDAVTFFKDPKEFSPSGWQLACNKVDHDRLVTYKCMQCNKTENNMESISTHHDVNHRYDYTRHTIVDVQPPSAHGRAVLAQGQQYSSDGNQRWEQSPRREPVSYSEHDKKKERVSPNYDLMMPKEPWYEADETDRSRRYRITCRQCRARTYIAQLTVRSYGEGCQHEDPCARSSAKRSYFYDCRACGWRYFEADGLQHHDREHHFEATAIAYPPTTRDNELSRSASSTIGLYSSSHSPVPTPMSVKDLRAICERIDLDGRDQPDGDFLHDALFEGHENVPQPAPEHDDNGLDSAADDLHQYSRIVVALPPWPSTSPVKQRQRRPVLDSVKSSTGFGSILSYKTAPSIALSPASWITAPSGSQAATPSSQGPASHLRKAIAASSRQEPLTIKKPSEYETLLETKGLILPQHLELNWSGQGQHVQFVDTDDIPLEKISHIDSSSSAAVDKVRCRRILLARKTMRCTRRWTIKDALIEVEHLNRLRHAHILQLVGSYVQKKTFAILLYPVADGHLGTFMEETSNFQQRVSPQRLVNAKLAPTWNRSPALEAYLPRATALAASLSCCVHAMEYIHRHTTKHMDIKPRNILVKLVPLPIRRDVEPLWRVYIADFGLSRSFADQGHSQTEGPTAYTPKYCAPEVKDYDSRGRSADIFSLGCVFLEILTVYFGFDLDDFSDFRAEESGDESFSGNLDRLQQWASKLRDAATMTRCDADEATMIEVVREMVRQGTDQRPTAAELAVYFEGKMPNRIVPKDFKARPCCNREPEPYVVESENGKPKSKNLQRFSSGQPIVDSSRVVLEPKDHFDAPDDSKATF